jgi:hypothetical protein
VTMMPPWLPSVPPSSWSPAMQTSTM